jgi:hypothetical protein
VFAEVFAAMTGLGEHIGGFLEVRKNEGEPVLEVGRLLTGPSFSIVPLPAPVIAIAIVPGRGYQFASPSKCEFCMSPTQ